MTTLATLISLALKDAGVLGEGETPNAEMTADALATFNQMLALWQVKNVLVYAQQEFSFAPTGALSYAVGPGATVDMTRPAKLDQVFWRLDGQDTPIIQLQTFEQYETITPKIQAGSPAHCFYNPTHTTGTLHIHPQPDTGTIHLVTRVSLPQPSAASETLTLPPEYMLPVRANLASLLAPMYGARLSPTIEKMAINGLRSLKRNNLRTNPQGADYPGFSDSPGSYESGIGGSGSGGGGGSGSSTITQVTGTAPINVALGTTTPLVSITEATVGAAGSMSAADKTTMIALPTSAGAGLVGFIQAGANAILRTLLAKARDIYSRADFATATHAVTDLSAGGVIFHPNSVGAFNDYVVAGQYFPVTTPLVAYEFNGPEVQNYSYNVAVNSSKSHKSFVAANGAHSDSCERHTVTIASYPEGSGSAAVLDSDYALGVVAVKKDWATTTTKGQVLGVNVVVRGGYHGAFSAGNGDVAAYISNVVLDGNDYGASWEAQVNRSSAGVVDHTINTQIGTVNANTSDYMGFYTSAQLGACTIAYACDSSSGTWTHHFRGATGGVINYEVSSAGHVTATGITVPSVSTDAVANVSIGTLNAVANSTVGYPSVGYNIRSGNAANRWRYGGADSSTWVQFAGVNGTLFASTGAPVAGGLITEAIALQWTATGVTIPGTLGVTGAITGALTGNASTSTALQTTRTIGGSNFNGTANVTSFPAPGAIGGTTPAAATFTDTTTTTLTVPVRTTAGAVSMPLPINGGTAVAGGPIAIEAVTAPTLLNSWVNYGGTTLVAGYYKDPFGRVWLQGSIKSGTIGLSVFVLPVGYRPTATVIYNTFDNGNFTHISIDADGTVSAITGVNVILSLDGVSFRST